MARPSRHMPLFPIRHHLFLSLVVCATYMAAGAGVEVTERDTLATTNTTAATTCPDIPPELTAPAGNTTEEQPQEQLYVQKVTDDCLRGMPAAYARSLPPFVLNSFGPRLALLPAAVVASLTPVQCRRLFVHKLKGAQCEGLSVECISAAEHINKLQAGCISFLRDATVKVLGRAVLESLRPESWGGFSAKAVGLLEPDQCQHIPPRSAQYIRSCRALQRRCLVAMSEAAVSSLKPACVKHIPAAALLRHQPHFYAALSPQAVAALTSQQFGKLSEECAHLPSEALPLLKRHHCANATQLCLSHLKAKHPAVLCSGKAEPVQAVGLPDGRAGQVTQQAQEVPVVPEGGGGVLRRRDQRVLSVRPRVVSSVAEPVDYTQRKARPSSIPLFVILVLTASFSLFLVKSWIDPRHRSLATQQRRYRF